MDKYDILKLDNQFCFSLYSLSKEIVRLYKPFLDKFGITYTQYITLLVLWENDGLKMNEIGERVCLDSGTLTPLLKKLEKIGLIERNRLKEDERNIVVNLTEKGKNLRDDALEIPKMIFEKKKLPITTVIEVRDKLKEVYAEITK